MADFVIGDRALLLVGEDGVLLLVARDDDFDAFLEVRLRDESTAAAHSAERPFVDDVRELGTRGTGCHARNRMEIDIAGQLDFLGVDFEDSLASLKVWQLDRHAPVEAAGTQESRVERFRAVCRRKDNDAIVALEAVHFGEELVQRLLALVVAHEVAAALLADGVDFVDEDDARRFFFGLLEEVTDFRCAHADEHLNELGACNREERHVSLARDGFREHRLAGARRADEQHAFRHLRADG